MPIRGSRGMTHNTTPSPFMRQPPSPPHARPHCTAAQYVAHTATCPYKNRPTVVQPHTSQGRSKFRSLKVQTSERKNTRRKRCKIRKPRELFILPVSRSSCSAVAPSRFPRRQTHAAVPLPAATEMQHPEGGMVFAARVSCCASAAPWCSPSPSSPTRCCSPCRCRCRCRCQHAVAAAQTQTGAVWRAAGRSTGAPAGRAP